MLNSLDPSSNIPDEEARLTFRLSAIVQEARKIAEELDPIVERWEFRSSEFLFGMTGGLFLGLIAFLFMYLYVAASIMVTSAVTVVGLLIGILIPLLLFRGLSQWRVEGNIRRLKLKLSSLRAELQELDGMQNVPLQIKHRMWEAYEEALISFKEAEISALRRELRGGKDGAKMLGN